MDLAPLQRSPFVLSSGAQPSFGQESSTLAVSEGDIQPEAPNGGLDAYLKVAGGFCVFFITLGVASTFGSYQAYYESDLLRSHSSSTISWIGTTQVFLLSFVGMFSGAFYDRGHVRLVLGSGMSLIVLGLFMLSLSRSYWQILLTQGVCVGAGSGLIYVPAVSIVSKQFTSKRTVALGITATGSAVGGVVLPIMFRKLLPSIHFGWVNRVLGFLVLLLATLAFFLLTDVRCASPSQLDRRRQSQRQRTEPRSLEPPMTASAVTSRKKSERVASLLSALHGRAYLFLCIGVFFVFLGYWVPLFYIVPFASLSLGTSSTYASYLLAILNAGSFFGRVGPAYLGQIIGTAPVLFAGATSLGVIVFAWLGIGSVGGITVWCFLVGFMSGIVVSIPNAVASRLSLPSNVGLRIGAMWTAGAFAELIGAPIAGALVTKSLDRQEVSYVGGQIFGGSSILLGAAFMVVPAWSIFKDDKVRASRSA